MCVLFLFLSLSFFVLFRSLDAIQQQVQDEICALLVEALKSMKTNLSDFSCVLPKNWVALINLTTSNIDPAKRVNQRNSRVRIDMIWKAFHGHVDNQCTAFKLVVNVLLLCLCRFCFFSLYLLYLFI